MKNILIILTLIIALGSCAKTCDTDIVGRYQTEYGIREFTSTHYTFDEYPDTYPAFPYTIDCEEICVTFYVSVDVNEYDTAIFCFDYKNKGKELIWIDNNNSEEEVIIFTKI